MVYFRAVLAERKKCRPSMAEKHFVPASKTIQYVTYTLKHYTRGPLRLLNFINGVLIVLLQVFSTIKATSNKILC
jgi:hypothetical protein